MCDELHEESEDGPNMPIALQEHLRKITLEDTALRFRLRRRDISSGRQLSSYPERETRDLVALRFRLRKLELLVWS